MQTRYHHRSHPHGAYACDRITSHQPTSTCRSIDAACVDAIVVDRLLSALTPAEITWILAVADEITSRVQRRLHAAELVVEHARYQADRAERAFADVAEYPATVHVTSISVDAQLHYHKRLTETYYFLECEAGAQMQLNDETVAVKPGMCILIPPGVRHRAIGEMKVLIIALPKFDPADEWLD